MSLENLNLLVSKGTVNIKSRSLTPTKYTGFKDAMDSVRNAKDGKKFVQHAILNHLKSIPITSFATIVDIIVNTSQSNTKHLRKKAEAYLLELPVAIIPIPLLISSNIQKNKQIPCSKYVILLSKPSDSNIYESYIIKFFIELILKLKDETDTFVNYALQILECAKNTLSETHHFFGATIIKRVCDKLFSLTTTQKAHIQALTDREISVLYDLEEKVLKEEVLLKQAEDEINKDEQKLLDKLKAIKKRIKRSKHANKRCKRILLNKKANITDRLNKINLKRQILVNNKFLYITSKRNSGNSKGGKWKHDHDAQRWICFLLDTSNFSTCHDRSLANRIIEKNNITGLKNKLEHFSCYYDIKLFIEKKYNIKNDLQSVKDKYKSIEGNIWDIMGDEVFENRIKSRSTFSEYYNNRNPNTIQGKRVIKMNTERSLQLVQVVSKGKTAVRMTHLNHWYSYNDIINVNKYYHITCEKLGIQDELICIHIDCASKKKFGTPESDVEWCGQKALVLAQQLDSKVFGLDKSSEFCPSTFFIQPIAICISKGSVDANGKWRRSEDGLLQYCVSGAAIDIKGDAFDMMNSIEIVHLNGVLKDTVSELFVECKNDELEELGLNFKTSFLKFRNRMKLIGFFL